ncbi:hypothetical protein D9M69_701470 [compost metagenome]
MQRLLVAAGAHQHTPAARAGIALAGAVRPHFHFLLVRFAVLHGAAWFSLFVLIPSRPAAQERSKPSSAWRLTTTDAARARLGLVLVFQAGPMIRIPATRLTADTR